MGDVLSLTITGSIGSGQEPGQSPPELWSSIANVLDMISQRGAEQSADVRVLTSAGDPDPSSAAVELFAAREASRRGFVLQLLSPGVPVALDDAQLLADRQVWLGAMNDADESSEALRSCGEIGLGLSDLVLWVRAGPDPAVACRHFHVVRTAALAMKPVVWVDSTGSVRALDLLRLTPARRNLIASGDPAAQWVSACFTEPLTQPDLLSWLRSSVVITDGIGNSDMSAIPSDRGSSGVRLHNSLLLLAQGRPLRALRALMAGPVDAYRGPTWTGIGSQLIAPTPVLDARFDAADIEASLAAGRYRSAVWVSSAASTLAVFAAVAGAIGLWPGQGGSLWAVLEVLLVTLIVGLLWRVKQQDWHTKWIGARFLAEQLRYARMGLPMLALGRPVYEPSVDVMQDDSGRTRLIVVSPELRSLQRCLAATGLPGTASDDVLVAASEHSLAEHRGYVLAVIDDQIAYHDKVHADQHAAGHVLHQLTVILFCLTGVAVAGHFVLHAEWLLIFTAFFPALAAGIHGLATSLEISRIAEQSGSTASELREIARAIRLSAESVDRPWNRWLQLRHLSRAAAGLMSEENGQWQKLVKHQKPKLPA